MELVTQAAGICILGALVSLSLRRGTAELALLLTLGTAAAVVLALAAPLGELLAFVRELTAQTGAAREVFAPLYKTLAIALVVRLGGGVCADAGERTLAAVLELTGTVCALTAALPLLRQVLDILMELI